MESTEEKSPVNRKYMLAVISLVIGCYGVHRFIMGKWKSGLLMFFTLGGLGVWWVYDTVRLFTGSFPDTDGVPFKDKIAEYESRHPKTEVDYSEVSFGKWMLLVELPWLSLIIGMIATPFAETRGSVEGQIACAVLMGVGLVAIFATIGLKLKIRRAKGLEARAGNPFSWFVSYTGKILLGTLFFCLGIGIFLFFAVIRSNFRTAALRGDSGGSSSSAGAGNAPTLYWFMCERCGTAIKQSNYPSSRGCPSDNGKIHSWKKL